MRDKFIFRTLFQIFLILSLTFIIAVNSASFVYAEEDTRVCCEKTKIDGEDKYCQYTEKKNCDLSGGVFPSKCEDVSVCKPVCCNVNKLGYTINGGQGCFKSVSLNTCVNDLKGDVIPDAQCNVPECKRSCCVVGGECALTTLEGCKDLTSTYPDLKLDYREDISDKLGCLKVCRSDKQGCCVTKGDKNTLVKNNCKTAKFSDCESAGGVFYEGQACTKLQTNECDDCKYKDGEKKKIGCAPKVDGGEDVYEFDKCGNPIDIVENCDYSKGTICKETNGTASCKNLNCAGKDLWDNPFTDENLNGNSKDDTKDFHGRDFRINGESWCEYDADAGPTRDLPGTRHFVHTCYEGEEIVQECKDYREEYCAQYVAGNMDQASCIPNVAAKKPCSSCDDNKDCCEKSFSGSCLWISSKAESKLDLRRIQDEQCAENKKNGANCSATVIVQEPKPEEGKGKCVPLVPPGTKGDNNFCKFGSMEFKSIWLTYGWGSEFHCESGCNLYTQKFAYNYNTYCKSLGDCGADFNLAGEWTNSGFNRKCDLKEMTPDDVDGYGSHGGRIGGGGIRGNREEAKDYDKDYYSDDLEPPLGNADKKGLVKELLANCGKPLQDPGTFTTKEKPENFLGFAQYKNALNYQLEVAGVDLSGFERGKTAAQVIGYIAGAIAGIAIAIKLGLIATATVAKIVGATVAGLASNWVTLIVAAVIAIILIVLSATMKSLQQDVNIGCKPWSPPLGSKNCNLCHEAGERIYTVDNKKTNPEKVDFTAGGLHQCTPYLCWSLGQACEYQETNNGPRCAAKECNKDVNAPKIKPLSKLNELNLEACTASNDGNNIDLKCDTNVPNDFGATGYDIKFIKANTDIIVGIETDELAICKWDWEKKNKYEELSKSFDQNLAAKEHTMKLEADRDLLPGVKKTMNIICKDVCENPKSAYPVYTVDLEVANMKDLGAPLFIGINPLDNGFLPANLFANSTFVSLKLNEKANCRWSRSNDPYELMKSSEFDCNSPSKGCNLFLTDIQEGPNTFFIRCKDKTNNTNVDSLPTNNGYKLTRTKPLIIDSIKCKNNLGADCGTIYDKNFTLEVVTSGGMENGKAVCSAVSSNGADYEFFNTNSSMHTQIIGPRVTGNYTESIRCKSRSS